LTIFKVEKFSQQYDPRLVKGRMAQQYQTLRLILGDQLNAQHPWFERQDNSVLYVMMELRSETDYAKHHIQKVIGFFAAMRLFARHLKETGHQVHYIPLDHPSNQQRFDANCQSLIQQHGIPSFEYQEPDEYRVDEHLKQFAAQLHEQGISSRVYATAHFFTERHTLKQMFAGKKTYLMETFYRKMRTQYGILMEADGKTPLSGRWNYDAENRKKLPIKQPIPPPPTYYRNVAELLQMLQQQNISTIGQLDDSAHFNWPLTRAESLDLLAHFVKIRLSFFGDYQDAMTPRDWVLFHSRLSFSLNIKLISPKEVIQACIQYWEQHPDRISIATLEGFVRQILGWREYMRGIYWAEMPTYSSLNFFEHSAPLPSWYWTAETKMNCLHHAISQSLDRAYAHHIQRLMVTGSFALLLGVHPDEVDAWYLGIYMDALEWVEMTNTRGMSQYADGGIVGSKPYVGSANYIDKMSDYCTQCHYDKSLRYGHKACPFNSLYWDFYDRHREKLAKNPRIGMMYPILNKMPESELSNIRAQATAYKQNIENL
jgi:deoxyribodipyrimidine photolyase-related protein